MSIGSPRCRGGRSPPGGPHGAPARPLLAAVQRYVRPGGLLVYALCTLTPEECDEQVQRFLTAHPAFRLDPPPPEFARECLDRDFLRTLPNRTGTDGFFAARLRRTA